MDDSENLAELKKAYADILLNTAKEAAARVMVSEKKAARLQREILGTKEEALRMLVRLKQTYDSKVGEVELRSLSQQKKIDELEAQLQEAEDIVGDLRGELGEVQDRLEKAKKNRAQIVHRDSTDQGKTSQYGVNSPGATSQQADSIDKKSVSNRTYEGSKSYTASDSLRDHNYVRDPDFTSLVMRSKEPEFYKNGCTQRIRAFERNLLADGAKNATFIREDGEGKRRCIASKSNVDNLYEIEKILVEMKGRQEDDNNIQLPAILSFQTKRKRTVSSRSRTTPPSTHLSHQPMEMCQVFGLSCSTTSQSSVNNNGLTDDSSKKLEDKTLTPCVSTAKLPSETTEMSLQSGCAIINESDAQLTGPWMATENDKTSSEKSELSRHECLSAEGLEVLASETDIEKDKSDLKASDLDDQVASQPVSNKFLQYTFQRKRKKETLSMSEGNSENDTFEGKTRENQNSPEPQQLSLITTSSRDSRRVALVAHQLISLSGMKR